MLAKVSSDALTLCPALMPEDCPGNKFHVCTHCRSFKEQFCISQDLKVTLGSGSACNLPSNNFRPGASACFRFQGCKQSPASWLTVAVLPSEIVV